MRISDWSSDVRSSDLLGFDRSAGQQPAASERRDRRHGQPHPAKCRHGGAEHGRRAQPCFGSEPTPEAGQPSQYKTDRKRETSPGRNAPPLVACPKDTYSPAVKALPASPGKSATKTDTAPPDHTKLLTTEAKP